MALPKATPSSLPGPVMTKWRKPAATDGPNYNQTGLSKDRFASKATMKPTSSRSLGIFLQQPARASSVLTDSELNRYPLSRQHASARERLHLLVEIGFSLEADA